MKTVNSQQNPMDQLSVIGLMAGTSLDGIDAVRVRSDGQLLQRVGTSITVPYSDRTRALLVEAVALGAELQSEPALCTTLDQRVADEHAEVVMSLMGPRDPVQLVGFHGQTVWHAPEIGRSLQLGDAQRLADRLQIPVVGQLRAADIEAGGEGAPLAPVYHKALLEQAGVDGPAAWLNLGGVANLTLVDSEVIAGFDCGPGNALMDRLVSHRLGEPWDMNGERASRGVVQESLRDRMLEDDYFNRLPPKSLDRDYFLGQSGLMSIEQLSLDNALATLCAVTVAGVQRGLALAPRPIETLVVSGGGVHNRAIMAGLSSACACRVITSDALGAPADGVEAELVAFLAARQLAGLATSFPATTGVASAVVGGVRYLPGSCS